MVFSAPGAPVKKRSFSPLIAAASLNSFFDVMRAETWRFQPCVSADSWKHEKSPEPRPRTRP
jgi:hypothetical protein